MTSPTPSPAQPLAPSPPSPPPYRQIRAHRPTPSTLIVYQAYSTTIATAAVADQNLSASPSFKTTRMTWIKPSWAWVLYRSGYSYKDSRQSRILAIEMTVDAFEGLLRKAVVGEGRGREEGKVRVQWDPERDVWMGKLGFRSIQVGIPGVLVEGWVEGIVGITDVTERARELKRVVDEEGEVGLGELVERGLVPVETEVVVDEELRGILRMERGREEGEGEGEVS
ncbi:hypothetical protein BU24DRAFT_480838 [Aaosphaeria arxii CBS 175.79]|uniref:Uncharacterized protein n=1 Tax=Aaosphaeria arxii CBS 175.79 TaxID=1450172 RepID=A0A6A5XSC6_9PLEO|nr:uncharacterized protein BU24DRAFT_480838 [Aaosphaeria arxii CBS 175.79]KAF2016235.1 hypothetical protein BU24DRAFT_480838 [Aaosphaeria arxii CBS 175.79]